jgi:hypothetical protein
MTDRQNQLGRDYIPHRDDGTRPRPNGALNEKRVLEGDDYHRL